MTTQDSIPVAKIGLRFRQFPKGVLFENGFALNETAFAIFDLCNGISSINDIAINLSQRYGCGIDEVLPHIETALELLTEADLIEWRK
jgi:hypothetical protein